MDWPQFLASIVGSLAWPATLLTLVIVLRSPLSRVLLTLTSLKYKDLEIDFGRELKRLEVEAKAIEVLPQPQKASEETGRDSGTLLNEAERLAQDFPEPAVAVAWQAVEHELLQAVMRLAVSPDYPPRNSALTNIELLVRQKAIDGATAAILNRMRNLRNVTVHGGRGQRISPDEAVEFIALARGILERLRALERA